MSQLALAGSPAGGRAALVFDIADAAGGNLLVLSHVHQRSAQIVALAHSQQAAHACPHLPPCAATGAGATPLPSPPRHQQQQQASRAARLNEQLGSIEARGSLGETASRLDASAADAVALAGEQPLRQRLAGLALRVGDMLQPKGEALGDSTWGERTANVLTSLPFVALGWHMHRQRLTPEGRHHARSMIAVGVAATVYHAASGRARRIARKIDYWTIAYTSSAMTKALFADSPTIRAAANASLLALPFRPFHVSSVHTGLMQAEFARQAVKSKAMRGELRRHYTAAALGLAAFFGEDMVQGSGWSGFVHAAWHCMACYSMYTLDGLLAHNERQLLQRRLSRQAGIGGGAVDGKPLRRPLHSSASSLPAFASAGGGGSSLAGCSPGTASP